MSEDKLNKLKHLEFLQAIITRMNQNSFQIKGWMVTLVSALIALYANSSQRNFVLVAAVPVVVFWLLDTYYLQQERKFRGIYNDVLGLRPPEQRIVVRDFEMPIQRYHGGQYNYWDVLWSRTIVSLYLPTLVLLATVFICSSI